MGKSNGKLLNQIINQSILSLLESNFGVVKVDRNCSIIEFNKTAEQIVGLKLRSTLGENLNLNIACPYLQGAIFTGQVKIVKEVIGERMFLIVAIPTNSEPRLLKSDLGAIGAIIILLDISELEDGLEIIRLLDQETDKLIDSIYDGIVISDAQGHILKLNKAYEFIAGVTREEYLGKHVDKLVEEGYFKSTMTARVISTGRVDSMMQELKSGRVALISGMPVLNERNELWRVIITVRDLSELEKIRKKLEDVESENINLKKELNSELVTYSNKMKEIFDLGKKVAKTDVTVLITGESGVGKDVLARYIHDQSSRKDNSFISVNCGAIPENLLESELFGYEKGAFTGATSQGKNGLLDMAQKGSFVFDEIGDLPLSLQVKLLRLLQDKEFFRVGGNKPTYADIRFIAATNKNLKHMVKEGSFRKDLFFRLNVVNVNIPPLRERKEEIIPLTWVFLKKFNEKYDQCKRIAQSVINIFHQYDWPGNTRELQNLIERLVVISTSNLITEEFLPNYMEGIIGDINKEERRGMRLKEALAKIEKEMLFNAYKQEGNTRAAAKVLGISQSAVVKKMKKYNIDCNKNDCSY